MIPLWLVGAGLAVGAFVLSAASDFLRGEASERERERHEDLRGEIERERNRQRESAGRFAEELETLARELEEEGYQRTEALKEARVRLIKEERWKREASIRNAQYDHFISEAKARRKAFEDQIDRFAQEKDKLYDLRREQRNELTRLRMHALDKMLYEFEEAVAKMGAYVEYLGQYIWEMERAKATNKEPFLFELTLPVNHPYPGKLHYATREELLEEQSFSSGRLDFSIELSEEDRERLLDYEEGRPVPLCLVRPKRGGRLWTASVGHGYYKEHLENAQHAGMEVVAVRSTRFETIVAYHGIELSLPLFELIQPHDRKPQPQMRLTVYPLRLDYHFFSARRLPQVTERFSSSLNLMQLDEIALAVPEDEEAVAYISGLSENEADWSGREWKIAPAGSDTHYRMQLGTEVALLVERIDDAEGFPLYFLFVRPLEDAERIGASDIFVVSEFTFDVREESAWQDPLNYDPERIEQTLHLKLFLASEFRKQRLIQMAVSTRLYYNKWTDLMDRLSLAEGRIGPFTGTASLTQVTPDALIRRVKAELAFERSAELEQFLDGPQAVFRHRQYMVMAHPRYGDRVAIIREESITILLEPGESMWESDLDGIELYYVGRSYAEHQQFHAISAFRRGELASPLLHELLLDPARIEVPEPVSLATDEFYNPHVASNPRQRKIVETVLGAKDLYMIQGPPGSGKTTVIQEIVRQHLKRHPHDRILITSQSNVAVDNVLVDFIEHYPGELVRCGNEDKIQRELADFSFEEVERNYRRLIAEKQVAQELEPLLTEWREELATEDSSTIATLILQSRQLIGATCVGLAKRRIGIDRLQFDLVIVDEAGRALPGEMLLPLVRAKKAILIGDHLQLPPTLPQALLDKEGLLADEEQEIKDELIGRSLFERLYEQVPDHAKNRLGTQYRMPTALGRLISELFYEGDLLSGPSTEQKAARHLPHVMTWLDLGPDKQYRESEKPLRNEYEAEVVLEVLERLDSTDTIGVITPYRAQKRLLNERIGRSSVLRGARDAGRLKVDTIDGFQGEEADIVLYCATRAVKKTNFFSDAARLNVALSRTKRELLVIGSLRYFKRYDADNPARRIAEYIEREGTVVDRQALRVYLTPKELTEC
ncbi:DEAD/DEAH box helicase [Exiguobacterium flavidum]|uniref:DEAD/DEAH box helicase n=1 Tax=Exiguobacterium flavidum TaxID=2184695 RepID=UPI000DF7BC04|nr:AAA domain-containing protein [Exiguobacterium flavidum]